MPAVIAVAAIAVAAAAAAVISAWQAATALFLFSPLLLTNEAVHCPERHGSTAQRQRYRRQKPNFAVSIGQRQHDLTNLQSTSSRDSACSCVMVGSSGGGMGV
jgi:hypothetical protein